MQKEADAPSRSHQVSADAIDPYRLGVQTVEEAVDQGDNSRFLKQRISDGFAKAAYGFLFTLGLAFLSAILAPIGDAGSYWGNWQYQWDRYAALHLSGLSAVFTLWSGVRALITALALAWRI